MTKSSNKVLFKLSNLGNTSNGSFISHVYLDDMGGLLSNLVANQGNVGEVDFETPFSGPGELPQGNNLAPAFGSEFALGRKIGGPANRWAIQGGETLGIQFDGDIFAIEYYCCIGSEVLPKR